MTTENNIIYHHHHQAALDDMEFTGNEKADVAYIIYSTWARIAAESPSVSNYQHAHIAMAEWLKAQAEAEGNPINIYKYEVRQ